MTSNAAAKKTTPTHDTATSEDPDDMQRFHQQGRANRMAALVLGESLSESRRYPMDKHTKGNMDEAVVELRRVMSKAADLAAKRSGNKYTTETGEFVTRSGHVVVTAVVTRVE